jgi:energy-coupling factor transporter ATP-binding protein EcfA2
MPGFLPPGPIPVRIRRQFRFRTHDARVRGRFRGEALRRQRASRLASGSRQRPAWPVRRIPLTLTGSRPASPGANRGRRPRPGRPSMQTPRLFVIGCSHVQAVLRPRRSPLQPDARFEVPLSEPGHHEALNALRYGVSERKGFICVTGEIGSGKTTTLRALMSQLDEETYSVATILNSYLTDLELLKTINEEFGLSGKVGFEKGAARRAERLSGRAVPPGAQLRADSGRIAEPAARDARADSHDQQSGDRDRQADPDRHGGPARSCGGRSSCPNSSSSTSASRCAITSARSKSKKFPSTSITGSRSPALRRRSSSPAGAAADLSLFEGHSPAHQRHLRPLPAGRLRSRAFRHRRGDGAAGRRRNSRRHAATPPRSGGHPGDRASRARLAPEPPEPADGAGRRGHRPARVFAGMGFRSSDAGRPASRPLPFPWR